ncbi:MAG: hypothetical protein H6Q69_222 [Firmicutes bacterium]|nr:hypothetical protein [Bacillota bacterium]
MPPKFKDIKKYCDNTGWVLTKNTDHWYYEKTLANGDVLTTRISHSVSKELSKNLWKTILKQQLKTTEEDFWNNI